MKCSVYLAQKYYNRFEYLPRFSVLSQFSSLLFHDAQRAPNIIRTFGGGCLLTVKSGSFTVLKPWTIRAKKFLKKKNSSGFLSFRYIIFGDIYLFVLTFFSRLVVSFLIDGRSRFFFTYDQLCLPDANRQRRFSDLQRTVDRRFCRRPAGVRGFSRRRVGFSFKRRQTEIVVCYWKSVL